MSENLFYLTNSPSINYHHFVPEIYTPEETTEIRWSIPTRALQCLKAAHLVHGEGRSLAEYAAELMFKALPAAFRKSGEMIAFHGDPAIKEKYIARVRAASRGGSRLVRGLWLLEGGKGLRRWLYSTHSSDHAAYETELGIPRTIARLEGWNLRGFDSRSEAKSLAGTISGLPLQVGSDLIPRSRRDSFVWMLIGPGNDGVMQVSRGRIDPRTGDNQRFPDLYARRSTGEEITEKLALSC